jgi:hypothetical protein
LLPRLAMIFALCLVAIAPLALPVEAQENGASILISPSSGVPGTEVTVRGYNFTANKWVDIYYDEDWIDDVQADGNGDFRVTFTVPDSYRGVHTVLARDEEGESASRNFTIRSELTVSPEEGRWAIRLPRQAGDTAGMKWASSCILAASACSR